MAVRNHRLAALILFAALAVLHSWPLASDPAGLARLDNNDAQLNTWIISWVPHALATSPLNLFEAPIFYPEHRSLAFSEHMFVPSVLGAPLIWAGVSPVLVYNLLIMLGLALSGFAMYWVMAAWTGSHWAGLVAGLAYAFNAHVLTRFVHLQAMHVEFFPLVLYAFDRVLTERRMKDAWLLAAAFVLQALCSNYLMVFTLYALVACAVVRWPEIGNRKKRLPAGLLLIAGTIALVVLAPFLWPYYQVDREYGLARSVDVVTQYNAGWRDYLATGGRLHYAWWSHTLYEGRTALFPGLTVAALALFALVAGRGLTDPRIRMALAIGVVGVAFSLGTSLPGYAFLHGALPLLSGLRNVARWGWLLLAAVAILAGFGVAVLESKFCVPMRRLGSGTKSHTPRNGWYVTPIIALGLAALITAEAIRTPIGYTPVTPIPKIYDRFAGQPVVIAEFPFYSGASVAENGDYVLANTRYFKPLLNGYSGFHPEPFLARGRALNSFPSEEALLELKDAGVTDVLVHVEAFRDRYNEAALRAIDSVPALRFVVEEDGIRLYRLLPVAP